MGPNALTQIGTVLDRREGPDAARALFAAAGLAARYDNPPDAMVPEAEVRSLHRCLWLERGPEEAAQIAWEAGLHTGNYLLRHRIPRLMQRILRLLPARVAASVLIMGIRQHAWTFAGSGRFEARVRRRCEVSISGCPICCPDACGGRRVCAFYTAVFQRLFRRLVHRRAQVEEIACEAEGAPACRFRITWP